MVTTAARNNDGSYRGKIAVADVVKIEHALNGIGFCIVKQNLRLTGEKVGAGVVRHGSHCFGG